MKVHYDKKEDIFMIQISNKKVDDAFETDEMIVHVTEKNEPVLLEIFNASRFFAEESKRLPEEVKQRFFSA